MIPIGDTAPQRSLPLATCALIAACAAAFVAELRAGPELDDVVREYGLVPARLMALGRELGFHEPSIYAPLVTSTFLHASGLHFPVNMVFLWVFGGHVEDRMGRVGYLAFYLVGGVVAGLTHVAAHPTSVIPALGASGAIAAVMGAYFLLHPGAWVRSFVFPVFWLTFRVPAALYLGLWFALQLYMGTRVTADGGSLRVAWWAHAGGFAFGGLVILLIGRGARD